MDELMTRMNALRAAAIARLRELDSLPELTVRDYQSRRDLVYLLDSLNQAASHI